MPPLFAGRTPVHHGQRKVDREGRPTPFTRTHGLHRAPVLLHEVPYDRKAQPEPLGGVRRPSRLPAGIAANTYGRNSGLIPIPESATVISMWEFDALEHDLDPTILAGELDGVGEQVPDHLLQAARVAVDGPGRRIQKLREPDSLCLGRRPYGLDGRLDEAHGLHRLDVQTHLARGDPAHVEKILDELRLHPGVSLDDFQPLVDLRLAHGAGAKDVGPAENRAQGCPQLVGEGREELVLRRAGPLGLSRARIRSLSRSSFRSSAACCTVSNSRALSIATAACAAMPTTNRSARSLNTPGEGWPKNSPPMTSPDLEITGTAR